MRTGVQKGRALLLTVVLVVSADVRSQVTDHERLMVIGSSAYSETIHVGGTIDGENTFSRTAEGFFRAFEPNVSLRISNLGNSIVRQPRIVLNDRGRWFTRQLLMSEVFRNLGDEKERALGMWQFVTDNRVHRDMPESALSYEELYDPVKILGVYGYGWCSQMASIISSFSWFNNQSRRYWFMTGHVATESTVEGAYALLDPDIEVFYLKSDNETIASKLDVAQDRYLIRRTHNYGKALPDDRSRDDELASNYLLPNTISKGGKQFDFFDSWYFADGHSLDFSLRPGESLTYDWSDGKIYHSIGPNGNPPRPTEFANGMFQYEPPFQMVPLTTLVELSSNVMTRGPREGSPVVTAIDRSVPASFVVKVQSPFVIVNATIRGSFVRNSRGDSLSISFSRTGDTWAKVWTGSGLGLFQDSISLCSNIATHETSALYQYFLRFDFLNSDSSSSSGIDSLHIETLFQASRFFMPRLRLGENTFEYSDSTQGDRAVAVSVKWRESAENRPPNAVDNALFPHPTATVDSTQFTFHWQQGTDPDGDKIVDFEFELSDRPDMKFPLSPTFQRYVSTMLTPATPSFRIPYPGLLNDGKTYYWRVRAKDGRGAWGDWSSVWSFVPHGVMPPVEANIVADRERVTLTWKRNPLGVEPGLYEVHASNEAMGFYPDTSTFIGSTSLPQFVVPMRGDSALRTYYRIVAVGSNGERSGPSLVMCLPYPVIVSRVDQVVPQNPYTLRIRSNDSFYTYWSDGTQTLRDSATVTVLAKPSWLSYDDATQSLAGRLDYSGTIRLANDSTMNTVAVRIEKKSGASSEETIKLTASVQNHLPVFISAPNPLATEGMEYLYPMRVHDQDSILGDVVRFRLVVRPSWLSIDSVTALAYGVPPAHSAIDTAVVAEAFDAVGGTAHQSFTLQINHVPEFSSFAISQAHEDSLYQYKLVAHDADTLLGDVLHWSVTKRPLWLTLDSLKGVISGIPRASDVGDAVVTVGVHDGRGGATEQSFHLTVLHKNHAPTFTAVPNPFATEDQEYSYTAHAVDQDAVLFGDKVRYRLTVTPSWVTIDTLTGTVRGTATAMQVGDTVVGVQAYDAEGGTSEQRYSLKILHVNHNPIILSAAASHAYEDSLYRYKVASSDVDSAMFGDKGKYSLLNSPSWLSVDSTSGVVSGIPRAINVGDTTVTVAVRDNAGGSAVQTYMLTVSHTNHAPVIHQPAVNTLAKSNHGFTREDFTYQFAVQAQDVDSKLFGDVVRYRFVTRPSWLRIDSLSGLVSGIPHVGNGDTLFTVIATDGLLADSLEVHIRVIHVNHPPVIASVPDTVCYFGARYSYQVVAPDPDTLVGDLRRYYLIQSPKWIAIDSLGGLISGIPPGSISVHTEVIEVEVRDEGSACATQRFSLRVSGKIGRGLEPRIPETYVLEQNYPNPFNPTTRIVYGVPQTSLVRLEIFNILGQSLGTLAEGLHEPGYYAIDWNGNDGLLSSGVYFYRVEVRSADRGETLFSNTKKMIFVK